MGNVLVYILHDEQCKQYRCRKMLERMYTHSNNDKFAFYILGIFELRRSQGANYY